MLSRQLQLGEERPSAEVNLIDHLCGVVKPMNKQELVDGILTFWPTVDEQICCMYIGDLRKVIPKVIEYQGNATGY